jgi:hypothetical protein
MPLKRSFAPPKIDILDLGGEHTPHHPTRIILHCTEGPQREGTIDIEGVAGYWRHQDAGYGTHLVIDAQGNTLRWARDGYTTWGTGGANTGSLQIEIIGYTSYTAAQWAACRAGLKQTSKWIAYWSRTHNIPISLSTEHGVCTHAMCSAAGYPTDHGDPGPNYPLSQVLRWARVYKRIGWQRSPNL